MEYEICAGFKINSTLLYSSDKHLFQKSSDNNSVSYYACYVEGCKSRIKVTSAVNCSYTVGASTHIHGIQEKTYLRLQSDHTLKIRASTENKRPREIFDEECGSNQEATADMQFAKRHRTMRYHQRKGIPRNPQTLAEVKEFFDNRDVMDKIGSTLHAKEPRLFYQHTVIRANFAYVIFSSESILANLPDSRTIRVDCTFKCVPKSPFKQLLILQTDHLNHVS